MIESWTVYRHPSDFPGKIIARKYLDGEATETRIEAYYLGTIRAFMIEKDMINMGRLPFDDPVIVETWLD